MDGRTGFADDFISGFLGGPQNPQNTVGIPVTENQPLFFRQKDPPNKALVKTSA